MSHYSADVPLRLQIIYLIGLYISLLSLGAFLAETFFALIASVLGITVLQASVVWIVIGVVTLFVSTVAIKSEVSE